MVRPYYYPRPFKKLLAFGYFVQGLYNPISGFRFVYKKCSEFELFYLDESHAEDLYTFIF